MGELLYDKVRFITTVIHLFKVIDWLIKCFCISSEGKSTCSVPLGKQIFNLIVNCCNITLPHTKQCICSEVKMPWWFMGNRDL